jgi:RNA 2',3'-cyclic 3'-phosphodiesterase
MADQPREAIRAFVALDLDATSLRRVARVADRLRMGSGAPSATWALPDAMHVTLKFMSELPIEAVAPLGDALRPLVEGKTAPKACPFRLEAFPGREHANVVIVELEDASGALVKFAERVDKLAHKHGIVLEERPFRPHVTLARLKRPYDARRWLRPELAEGAGDCRAAGLTLFRSDLGTGEAKHVPLARFVFSTD